MNDRQLQRLRIYFTALVALAEFAHLAWEHFNGGIASHHILNRSSLPLISNAWGLLLLPVLAWLLGGFVVNRIAAQREAAYASSTLPVSIVVGFIGALLFGLLLAGSFASGHKAITSYLFQGMFVLALVLRVYRAEYVFGFILGMTFTFGAVLPTAVAALVAALSALAHLVVYPFASRIWRWLGRR